MARKLQDSFSEDSGANNAKPDKSMTEQNKS